MPNSQRPAGLLLSRLPGLREVNAKGCRLTAERQARRAAQEETAAQGGAMIYKRGKYYWYRFMWDGRLIRESTRQGNDKIARNMESAHRTALAKGEVGIREKKAVPTLADFAKRRFLPWVETTFASSPKTWLYYRNGVRRLLAYPMTADAKLDELGGERIAAYVAHRQTQGIRVSSINRELQVLRRMLRAALEWGVIERAATVKMLPGERHREFVLAPEEEARYLSAAPEPLASIASVLADTGMRPEECYRLRWEAVTWANWRNGTLLVTHGKTAAARRVLPLTPRVRGVLQTRWEGAGRPLEGWVWPAPTRPAAMWRRPA